MKIENKLIFGSLILFLAVALTNNDFVYSQDKKKSENTEKVVPDIGTWTQLPKDHQEIDFKTPCMICHNFKIDATTTATKQMARNGNKLGKFTLWKRISDYLGAGKQTRTFVMATSFNNIPLSTTCDQMLDPVNQVLYAFFEIGTEKLEHLQQNPHVSLNWHKPWESDFSKVLCVQVRGRAKLFNGSSPEFEDGFKLSFPTLPKNQQKEILSRIKENMVMCRITIDQVVLFDGTLLTQKLCSYQMWRRTETFSPSSYTKKQDSPIQE